jgi:hypothetical protein
LIMIATRDPVYVVSFQKNNKNKNKPDSFHWFFVWLFFLEMYQRPAASDSPRGSSNYRLRKRWLGDPEIRLAICRSASHCRLPPGNPDCHSHAIALLPHRRTPRLQRGLSTQLGQVGHRRITNW